MTLPEQIEFCKATQEKIEAITSEVRASLSDRDSGPRHRVIAKLSESISALEADIRQITAEIRNAEEIAKRAPKP